MAKLMKPWIVVTYRSIIYGLCILLTGFNIYKNGIFDVIGNLTDPILRIPSCMFISLFIIYSIVETIRCIISLFLFSQFIISYTFLVQKNAMYIFFIT